MSDMNNCLPIAAFSFLAFALVSQPAFCGDIFVGKYTSLSKQEQGLGEHGKYTIYVKKTDTGYTLDYFNEGSAFFTMEVQRCSEKDLKIEYFHSYALPGELQVLCDPTLNSVQFFYSQNGIKLPDRMAPEELIRKAQYYANVQWAFFGFKKVE
jgi:hypothetical protein